MFQRKKSKSPPDKGDSADNPDGDDDGEEWDDGGDNEGRGGVDEVVGEEVSDGKGWVKKVDPSLRRWIEDPGCRRDASDEYFNNPPWLTRS